MITEELFNKDTTRLERLSIKEKMGFGFGDAACNMIWGPITMFLTYFYTDIYRLDPALIASLLLFVRVFDAVADPFMGAVADRTRSRWGRFRPYLLWGAVPFVISCMMMFYTPEASERFKIFYAFAAYFILSGIYTIVNIPYCSLGGVITSNPEERVSCQQYRFAMAGVAILFCSLTLLPLVEFLGSGNRQMGFFWAMTLFALMGLAMFLTCFYTTRERVKALQENEEGIFRSFISILKNDQWVICAAGMFLDCVPSFIRGGAIIFFAKYVMQLNTTWITLFMSIGVAATILGSMLTKYFTTRWCKVRVYIGIKLLLVFLSLGFYLIDPLNLTLMLVFYVVLNIIHQITTPILWSFIGDVDDYGEWKLGKRMSGICASGNLFALKLSLAFCGAFIAITLSLTDYIPDNPAQPAQALSGILFLVSLVPAIGYLASALLFRFYRLDRHTMREIQLALLAGEQSVKRDER